MEAEELLKKRFEELAEKSYRNNQYTFTGFLSLTETDLFHRIYPKISYVDYTLFGGKEGCERQILRFGSEKALGYNEEFPIACVEIAPLTQKFADILTHRDFLGSLMNLGIERSTLGDIIVYQNTGYVFCLENIALFLAGTLNKVKHTHIKCQIVTAPFKDIKVQLEEMKIQVSSERIDAVISKVCYLSRNDSIELFRQKRIFVNGKICENNSYLLKKSDVITARGFGKFIYKGYEDISKKGKKNVIIEHPVL